MYASKTISPNQEDDILGAVFSTFMDYKFLESVTPGFCVSHTNSEMTAWSWALLHLDFSRETQT